MNPPPLPSNTPPPLPSGVPPPLPAKPKRSLLAPVLAILSFLFVAYLGVQLFRMVRHARENPIPRPAGSEELKQATSLIVGASHGVAHGNTAEAKSLAEQLSREMKVIRETMFEGGNADSIDMKLITKGEFIVYCQLNDDSCAFVLHVPEMRRFRRSAQESMAELAYVTAAKILDTARKKELRKLAIATRGNMLFDRVLIGDYQPGSKEPLRTTQKAPDEGVFAPSLYPFFAPKTDGSSEPAP